MFILMLVKSDGYFQFVKVIGIFKIEIPHVKWEEYNNIVHIHHTIS